MTADTAPAPPPRRRIDRNLLLGVGCIVLAGLLFSLMGGAGKLLGQDYSPLQVSWARAFGHLVFMLAAFLPRFGLGVLRARRPGVQITRAALLTTSNVVYFMAITFIPLATAASISLTGPLIVALLAWPMLGERTTPGRAVALVVGFLGVLVVIRPGADVFHPATLLVLLNALSYALYQLLTRRVAGIDSPETSALWSCFVGAAGLLVVLPFVGEWPHYLRDFLLFCALGLLGGTGHYLVARGLTYAGANVVTPFQYFQLITSVLVGWTLFADFPDAMDWLGAAIIIASGLYIGWSHSRR